MLHSETTRRLVFFERDGYRCRFCGSMGDERELVVSRVGLLGAGTVDGPDGLVTACRACAARIERMRGEATLQDRNNWVLGPMRSPSAASSRL
jgi:hypothetical protein